MESGLTWYERIPAKDRLAVDSAARWLRPVSWQFFVTATFPWNVRSETAVYKLRQFTNNLERLYRANMCFVAGQESKSGQHGMSVPNHFHVLLASHARLAKEDIEVLWLAQVKRYVNLSRIGESIRVESYNTHMRGAEYCLKAINDAYGDWHIHRLELFLPHAAGPSKPSHRSVRHDRRNREQAIRLASTDGA